MNRILKIAWGGIHQGSLETFMEAGVVSCGCCPSQIVVSFLPAFVDSKHLHSPQVKTVPNTDPYPLGTAGFTVFLGLDFRTFSSLESSENVISRGHFATPLSRCLRPEMLFECSLLHFPAASKKNLTIQQRIYLNVRVSLTDGRNMWKEQFHGVRFSTSWEIHRIQLNLPWRSSCILFLK